VARVNGFSFEGSGATLVASWRATGTPDAFLLECSAARPGPSWSTDLTIGFAADALARSGDRFSVGLAGAVDGMTRCRVAAEMDGVLGVRSNASSIPLAAEDDGGEGSPESGTEREPGRPVVPGAPADAGRPVVPGAPADAGRPVVPGPGQGQAQNQVPQRPEINSGGKAPGSKK
jgi:hypothetical protein